MNIQITKDTMQKLLVTRTYVQVLGQFIHLLIDVTSQQKIEEEVLTDQTKKVLNHIAGYIQGELLDYQEMYNSIIVPIAKEHNYTLTDNTGLTLDLENDMLIFDESQEPTKNSEVLN